MSWSLSMWNEASSILKWELSPISKMKRSVSMAASCPIMRLPLFSISKMPWLPIRKLKEQLGRNVSSQEWTMQCGINYIYIWVLCYYTFYVLCYYHFNPSFIPCTCTNTLNYFLDILMAQYTMPERTKWLTTNAIEVYCEAKNSMRIAYVPICHMKI